MTSRREFLASTAASLAAGIVGCAGGAGAASPGAGPAAPAGGPAPCTPARTITGGVSGKTICIPETNAPPMPALAASGVVHDGKPVGNFGIDPAVGYPDVRSSKRKFGMLIPATNTSMEHELWSIIFNNSNALDGVGLHTSNVVTPRPQLKTEADLLEYKRQFIQGLNVAIEHALLAQPQYLIMGMSLEHILHGIEPIRALMTEAESRSGMGWATWHDAAPAALRKFNAKRIGLLTPFDQVGNENAKRMFQDLGFEVVSSVGFACANALHIAHVPDEAKERAITTLLATRENRLEAIVQCGTNMSLINVTEKLESKVGIPILGINAVTFWYALRENGFNTPLLHSGRLLREF